MKIATETAVAKNSQKQPEVEKSNRKIAQEKKNIDYDNHDLATIKWNYSPVC